MNNEKVEIALLNLTERLRDLAQSPLNEDVRAAISTLAEQVARTASS